MLERDTHTGDCEESDRSTRIRLKRDGVEAFAAPGGFVRLEDKTGRQIAYVGIEPRSTRFLSFKGLRQGTYKVELESLTGMIATATFEA